ncbi:MAG: class IV adenylate cyclase [Chloroflexi bacterium]|nr:class IV adenylate cyclase [Chloroflexota bacterium]
MTKDNREIESKFYVRDLALVETILKNIDAKCIVPRGFEYNLRFDNQQKSLQRQHKILRLRKFDDIRLTFKGPGERIGNALSREEIELVVNDFDQAQKFLEGLGYRVAAVYEKYRTMYQVDTAMVTLDELPFGKFVEIEAENPEQIKILAGRLGLNSEFAIPNSYQGLFEQVKSELNLPVKNLAFWEFESIHLTAADLGVKPADASD